MSRSVKKSRRNLKPKGYFEKLIKQMVFQKSKKSIWLFWFFKKRKKQRKEYIYNIIYLYI
nr:MAG TPA: hypothetical protein [Caudoviricetes sp.]